MSAPGFLGAPALAQRPDAPFAVAGIAWDGSVSHRPGARFGPEAIRRAGRMLCDGTHPLFGGAPVELLADAGDLALPNTSLDAMRAALPGHIAPLIARHRMLWLGGDHSITLPLLRAYREWLGQPLALLHFDAHCDTWTDHFAEPSGHGTWVHEAARDGLIDLTRTVQIGIRSAAVREARDYVSDRGGRVVGARELRGRDGSQLAEVIADIRARLAGAPAYLSFDIDCLDPAFAPGTGTPEPGGLSSSQALTFIEELADLDWIGMDLCEVAPAYDHADLTTAAAATLAWTWLAGQQARRERA
nr:agmatinase [Derxia lacustris]